MYFLGDERDPTSLSTISSCARRSIIPLDPDGHSETHLRRQRRCAERPVGLELGRLRPEDQALSLRSEKSARAARQSGLSERSRDQALSRAGPPSQRQGSLRSDRRSIGQGRHQSRAGAARVRRSIGARTASTAASCRSTTPAATAATPIPISINTFAPAYPSASATAIRNSTSSSRKNNSTGDHKKRDCRYCIRRAVSSWKMSRSCRSIRSRNFTA